MNIIKEYINEKFTQESDPIQDLGIGLKNNPKILLPIVCKELKKYGIIAEWESSYEFGPGHYDIYIEGNDTDEDMDVQYFYSTDAAAHEEGWKGGFSLANDEGINLCKISHDRMISEKALIKRKFGNKSNINKEIKKLENQLQILKEVEKIV